MSAWTADDKAAIFLEIISKMPGSIPWAELKLPECRTVKAVQVMVDREKTKIRKMVEANGESPPTPASGKGKKRTAMAFDADDKEGGSKPEKAKTPRKKKVKASEDENETSIKTEDTDGPDELV